MKIHKDIADEFGDVLSEDHPESVLALADMLLAVAEDVFISILDDRSIQLFARRLGPTRINLYDQYGVGLASAVLRRIYELPNWKTKHPQQLKWINHSLFRY